MLCPLQRQSNMSSSTSGGRGGGGGGGGGGDYSKSTTASPYQSQLYDSWKTEWGGTPAYGYEHQVQGYRPSGGGGGGSSEDSRHYRGGSYMTKGGRRPSYDDDF